MVEFERSGILVELVCKLGFVDNIILSVCHYIQHEVEIGAEDGPDEERCATAQVGAEGVFGDGSRHALVVVVVVGADGHAEHV